MMMLKLQKTPSTVTIEKSGTIGYPPRASRFGGVIDYVNNQSVGTVQVAKPDLRFGQITPRIVAKRRGYFGMRLPFQSPEIKTRPRLRPDFIVLGGGEPFIVAIE